MKNSEAPAYPASEDNHTIGTHGLSKRELIAAMALQGLLSAGYTDGYNPAIIKECCNRSIAFADELLNQLEKTTS